MQVKALVKGSLALLRHATLLMSAAPIQGRPTPGLGSNSGSGSFEVRLRRAVKDCPNSPEVEGHSKCALLLAGLKCAPRVHFCRVSIQGLHTYILSSIQPSKDTPMSTFPITKLEAFVSPGCVTALLLVNHANFVIVLEYL